MYEARPIPHTVASMLLPVQARQTWRARREQRPVKMTSKQYAIIKQFLFTRLLQDA